MAHARCLDFDEDFMVTYWVFQFYLPILERCARICVHKSFSDHVQKQKDLAEQNFVRKIDGLAILIHRRAPPEGI
jgi:hypothetical protein